MKFTVNGNERHKVAKGERQKVDGKIQFIQWQNEIYESEVRKKYACTSSCNDII